MMIRAALAIRMLMAFVALAGGVAAAQVEAAAPYLEKDRRDLEVLLAGVWSNDRQVFFAEEAGYRAADRSGLQVLRISVADPASADLVSERSDGRAAEVHWRHQIRPNPEAGLLEEVIFRQDLTPADCRIAWKRSAGGFAGVSSGEGCTNVFPAPGGAAPVQVRLSVSARELNISVSRGDMTHETQMRRARAFTCWAGIMKGAAHGDTGEGLVDWDFRQAIELHDQGGEAVIETAETPARRIRLRLRDVDWPYGDRRASLTLYVYEGDNPRAASYAWAEGGADRIGINLRWLQASCTRQGAD